MPAVTLLTKEWVCVTGVRVRLVSTPEPGRAVVYVESDPPATVSQINRRGLVRYIKHTSANEKMPVDTKVRVDIM